MQLASHGARAIARNAPSTARSIHIPAAARPQTTHLGHRLLTHTRLALTRFVTHLTTPGTGTVSAARSFHAVNPSIQQRLSFTARTTLARPLAPQFLPRGPVVPRTMTQVGLGTARNFSSGRPLFQQLADNVPIAGRAFYEADWDLDSPKERLHRKRRPSKKAAAAAAHSKELLKPTTKKAQVTLSAPAEESEAELNRYFAAPVADVTTYLLVPLAPTPTARAPLPEFPTGRLPLSALLAMHDDHDTQALRVSSLFHRLDTADVWSRGAVCSAYASSADARGVCTILKVEFAGWSKAAVRGVLGESGTGWCVLEETTTADAYDADGEDADAFSETSSILSGMASPRGVLTPPAIDPAQSFVLPTLDFSSSFLAASGASATASWAHHDSNPASARGLFSTAHSNASTDSDLGAWSDSDLASSSSIAFIDPPSENGWFERRLDNSNANPWLDDMSDSDSDASASDLGSDGGWMGLGLGFSSEFGRRMATTTNATPEPLESVFA
ncbi:hypothetical protein C8F04DRAFT_1134688 [Mycena alexandri]|uniref:Uncharacterized protein n=1 Tax=Mycena alexandri TaxID=1745969 RepID=A0AAD6WW56_9AGAR|nr:hypothetical protein C8F04DRAFT_1134688 [Mycena alexandri]